MFVCSSHCDRYTTWGQPSNPRTLADCWGLRLNIQFPNKQITSPPAELQHGRPSRRVSEAAGMPLTTVDGHADTRAPLFHLYRCNSKFWNTFLTSCCAKVRQQMCHCVLQEGSSENSSHCWTGCVFVALMLGNMSLDKMSPVFIWQINAISMRFRSCSTNCWLKLQAALTGQQAPPF